MASAIGTYIKQPYEEVFITVDFNERLGAAEEIVSGEVIVTDKGGAADYSVTMTGALFHTEKTLICMIKGGEHNRFYNASYRIVTDKSQKFEADVIIRVKEIS